MRENTDQKNSEYGHFLRRDITEAHLRPHQTSIMEQFCKNIFYKKSFILDLWQGPKYVSW